MVAAVRSVPWNQQRSLTRCAYAACNGLQANAALTQQDAERFVGINSLPLSGAGWKEGFS